MAGAWRALVLVVGLAAMACVAQRLQSYEEIVNQAVRFFNYGRRGQPLFGLLEAIPPPSSNSTTTTQLNFRIKETVCLSEPRRQPRDCAFKEGGEEQNCTGFFFFRGHYHALAVNCHLSPESQQEVSRAKRSAASPTTMPSVVDSSKLPPVIRDMYERAKFDIIANILSNF